MTQDGKGGRDVLPIPDRRYEALVTFDASLITLEERLRIAMARQ